MTTTYSPATFALKKVDADHDYQIYQGATYDQVVQLTLNGAPLNMSAYGVVRMHLRKQIADAAPYITPATTWVDASLCIFRIRIEAATTAALTDRQPIANGVADVEVVNGTDVLRIASDVTWDMSPEVTR